MTRHGLMCLLLGAMAWAQTANPTSTPAPQNSGTTAGAAAAPGANPAQGEQNTPAVAPDAPVITINGLCDNPPADKTPDPNCKTVITRAQFEEIMNTVQPMMPPRSRRMFATRYAGALVASEKAHQMGLDQGPKFEEKMRLARLQILNQALMQSMQEKASQISDKDIEDYYNNNLSAYEEADLHRIFVPRTQTKSAAAKTAASKTAGGKPGDSDEEKTQNPSEVMRKEADKLRARAAAGESFSKLQAEAYALAGTKAQSPNISMPKTRRSGLAPDQASVMDLKSGAVSPVIADQSGYYIYKVGTKTTLPLDQVKEEIRGTLRSQRMQDSVREMQQEGTPTLNDAYFGAEASGPGRMPPGAMPPQGAKPQVK